MKEQELRELIEKLELFNENAIKQKMFIFNEQTCADDFYQSYGIEWYINFLKLNIDNDIIAYYDDTIKQSILKFLSAAEQFNEKDRVYSIENGNFVTAIKNFTWNISAIVNKKRAIEDHIKFTEHMEQVNKNLEKDDLSDSTVIDFLSTYDSINESIFNELVSDGIKEKKTELLKKIVNDKGNYIFEACAKLSLNNDKYCETLKDMIILADEKNIFNVYGSEREEKMQNMLIPSETKDELSILDIMCSKYATEKSLATALSLAHSLKYDNLPGEILSRIFYNLDSIDEKIQQQLIEGLSNPKCNMHLEKYDEGKVYSAVTHISEEKKEFVSNVLPNSKNTFSFLDEYFKWTKNNNYGINTNQEQSILDKNQTNANNNDIYQLKKEQEKQAMIKQINENNNAMLDLEKQLEELKRKNTVLEQSLTNESDGISL